MKGQTAMFGKRVPSPSRKLGPRQVALLLALRETGSMSTVEAGMTVHAEQGKHLDTEECDWCEQDGRDVLYSLRQQKLVVQRRATRLWEAVGWEPWMRYLSAQDDAEIPY